MTRLHQVVPILHEGDAVGAHSLHVRDLLRSHGIESDIFSAGIDARTAHLTRPVGDLGSGPVLYQMAVVSPLVDRLLVRVDPVAVDYHNITPPRFFSGWDRPLTDATSAGRRQLRQLAPHVGLGIGDSAYNAADLEEAGAPRVEVAPVLFDAHQLDAEPDESVMDALRAGRRGASVDWLFVGRVVPNKAQHDLVLALAAFRRAYDPGARLFLVGPLACPPYAEALRAMAADLGLADAVHLVGGVSAEVLAAHYRSADVFVCLSEHEGFCVPLLEAMHYYLPVVAHRSSAVGETVASGGHLVAAKTPRLVAAAVARALSQREALVTAGLQRLEHFSLARSRARMWDVLEAWLSDLP